jgi:ubiquinone/menaquinone biosynthesis C-methylase UbiE
MDIFYNKAVRYEEWFEHNSMLLDAELEAIRQLLPDFQKGVEIGVGTGIFASQLNISQGVEPSEEMGAMATKRGIKVISAKAEKLPINDGEFQLALMVTVDCFLDDIPQAFAEVRRILVNGGSFIIAFLDHSTTLGAVYQEKKEQNEFYRDATFHSSTEIIEMLEQGGFKITRMRQTIFSLDNKPQEIKEGIGEGLFAVICAVK